MNVVPTTRSGALRAALADPHIVVAPGCYDALSALMIEQAGFAAAYLSGASVAYARFGRPDIGLVSMNEVASTVGQIRERVGLPLVVDADDGYGNALNVLRTVKLFERMGASALQIEDQASPKRCGHLDQKRLVPASEMAGKIKAALDARRDDDLLIIARTDAIAVEGFEAALDRAELYVEAGAEVLFVEAPRSQDELVAVSKRFGQRLPLMANIVEGGKTPALSASELEALGFSLVIFPGGTIRAVTHHLRAYFDSLRDHGSTQPFRDRMLDFDALQEVLGTADMLATGKRFSGDDG